ncbi:MAG: MarR family winged helix-turn-helix transcriptional regulator [Nocardioides sp.]
MSRDPRADAEQFADAFAAIYLAFHRRDGKRSRLSSSAHAVLSHLELTGPLTVTALTSHLDRTQSVVSDIVTTLAGHGLIERVPDPRDRRRTLVWLSDEGIARLARDRRVLDLDRLAAALSGIPSGRREQLLSVLTQLTQPTESSQPSQPTQEER